MPKKRQPIPVNHFGDEFGVGFSINRLSFQDLPDMRDWEQPERHDRHSFFLLEKGSVTMEIDFERYHIQSPGVIYMHPDQVHRIIEFKNVTVTAWAVNNESLNSEYLQLLEDINPAAPVLLNAETFGLLSEAACLCIKIIERKIDIVYQSLLNCHGNALVGLIISTYNSHNKPFDKLTRTELVTKAFRDDLAHHFIRLKRPKDYAEKRHLSTAYLNECVKSVTGQPVSYHIQQRVILEAKRLLYHSDQSLKEIAAGLGYDDYPYFSRLFTKIAGMPPLVFRNKNHD
jgi:AraC family transcriptional activator of pobA